MQAYSQVWKSITGIPAGDLSAAKYKAVKYDTDGNIVLAGAGEYSIGSLYEPNKVGQPAQVVNQGFAFGILGATVANGAEVEIDAAGRYITLASGKKVGVCHVGGAVDTIGTILLG